MLSSQSATHNMSNFAPKMQDGTTEDRTAHCAAPCGCSANCSATVPLAAILRRADEIRNLSDTKRHEYCFNELRTLADLSTQGSAAPYSVNFK